MVRAFIRRGDGSISQDAQPDSLRAALRADQAVMWVDMQNATEEELSLLDDVFAFHPLAIEDSIKYSQRPKIESYRHAGSEGTPQQQQGYFYMVIHGPDVHTFRQ